jgi:hypothetical protein
MEWNPVTETLHRAPHGDLELLVWTQPDSWAWAVIRVRGPNPEANVVLGTGEAGSEEDAKAKAQKHAEG